MALSIRLEGLHATEEVGPGGRRRIPLTIRNAGGIGDQFRLALNGLQEDWYTPVGKIPFTVTKAETFVLSASDAGRTVSRVLAVSPPIKKLSVTRPLRHLDLPTIQQVAVNAEPPSIRVFALGRISGRVQVIVS
jgi:hypothetical protein